MGKRSGSKRPSAPASAPKRLAAFDTSPPDPRDATKVNPVVTGSLAAKVRREVRAETEHRIDHVKGDDASPRSLFVLGADGIPRLVDDDADEAPNEVTRAAAPSAELRARAARDSARPKGRLVRGADGVARFVDEDADERSGTEVTRVAHGGASGGGRDRGGA